MRFFKYIIPTIALCAPSSLMADDSQLEAARNAVRSYDFDSARSIIDNIETANRKNKRKNPLPEGIEDVKDELERASAMLDRVEAIEIIDSLMVPKRDFFTHYRLSRSAGSLAAPTTLPKGFPARETTVVFTSEDGTLSLWGSRDDSGRMTILESDRLADGTYALPVPIKGELGDGDINFPYLLPDGVTLYYSSTGNEDSLGGYDIYMTRREDGQYLLPQNVGMPYNSPFNDYMLAIDEERGLGWWATDRNAPDGMVCIYTFIPSDMRRNYPADTPGLNDLAFIRSIKATQIPGKDYSAYKYAGADETAPQSGPAFSLSVPGRGIYHRVADFASPQARELMEDYLEMLRRYDGLQSELSQARAEYRKGRRELAPQIIDAEKQIDTWRADLRRLSNEIIRAEQSAY